MGAALHLTQACSSGQSNPARPRLTLVASTPADQVAPSSSRAGHLQLVPELAGSAQQIVPERHLHLVPDPPISQKLETLSSDFESRENQQPCGFDGPEIPVIEYSYDDYGAQIATPGGDPYNPYRFQSQPLDEESGLYYLQARYYNPGLGKFIQADPLRYGAGLNLYDYCANDPVNNSDPRGLSPWSQGAEQDAPVQVREIMSAPEIFEAETEAVAQDAAESGSPSGMTVAAGATTVAALAGSLALGLDATDRLAATNSIVGYAASGGINNVTPAPRMHQVQLNRASGKAAEAQKATEFGLDFPGVDIRQQQYFNTPLGARFPDFTFFENGVPVFNAEVKSGDARYNAAQQAKDDYILKNLQVITYLIRI
jgi:RHS repeat-associated protein